MTMNIDPGERPIMMWVDKRYLRVDQRYQRHTESNASAKVIRSIAANFVYAHCAPLIATDNGDGTYNVIDGQHRMKAAKAAPKIKELPCYVITEMSLKEQAAAFVAHNKDRVIMTPYAIWHAAAAAGDPEAVAIRTVCAKVGVHILRSNLMQQRMKPGDTLALKTIQLLYRGKIGFPGGVTTLENVLGLLMQAWPTPGSVNSFSLKAVCKLLEMQITLAQCRAILAATSHQDLMKIARIKTAENPETRVLDNYFNQLFEAGNRLVLKAVQ